MRWGKAAEDAWPRPPVISPTLCSLTEVAATGAVELMTNMATEATGADEHRFSAAHGGEGGTH